MKKSKGRNIYQSSIIANTIAQEYVKDKIIIKEKTVQTMDEVKIKKK